MARWPLEWVLAGLGGAAPLLWTVLIGFRKQWRAAEVESAEVEPAAQPVGVPAWAVVCPGPGVR